MKIFQVDSFTNKVFRGNPAGVCIIEHPMEEGWMLEVAREMNASETAFVLKNDNGFDLRWFSPEVEVDLCGHGTLAAAHILWEKGYVDGDSDISFETKSGTLKAKQQKNWIELNFPSEAEVSVVAPRSLERALGVPIKYVGKNRMDYLVEVETEVEVRQLKPDFGLIARLPTRGVIVTSVSKSEDYDFVSRFFAPAIGVNEDPVTGSAHCCLAAYWNKRLNKTSFTAYQASSRGGIVKASYQGDRVVISGMAVTVIEGELLG